ncbi:EMB2654 [Symbiodinium sp. CCMP2592]|nr:EMB2654 [Symbiodinium sp. CCMP2592]
MSMPVGPGMDHIMNMMSLHQQALHQLVDSQHETLREALRHADVGDEVVQPEPAHQMLVLEGAFQCLEHRARPLQPLLPPDIDPAPQTLQWTSQSETVSVPSPRVSDDVMDHAVSAKIQEIDSQLESEIQNGGADPDSMNLGRMSEGTNPFGGKDQGKSPILMRLDMLAGIFVLLNSLVMAVELELEGRATGSKIGLETLPGVDMSDFFNACDNIFAVLYFLELCARIYYEGCRFFRGAANWFDIFLATTTCLDVWLLRPMALGGGATDQMILLRLARAVKSMRAIRMVRTLRLFRGLRVLVMACISFLPSLCWSMVLLAVFMIMGALMLGNLLQEFIANPDEDMIWREWIWVHYGTALRSMYTLYEITFAGNWPTYARPVIDQVSSVFSIFFLAYITLVVFAVIRVITAIFLKDTLDAASNDAEHLVVERLQKKSQYVKKLERVFQAIDETGNGMISQSQLSSVLQDPIVRAYFQTLEVDVHEGVAGWEFDFLKFMQTRSVRSVGAQTQLNSRFRLARQLGQEVAQVDVLSGVPIALMENLAMLVKVAVKAVKDFGFKIAYDNHFSDEMFSPRTKTGNRRKNERDGEGGPGAFCHVLDLVRTGEAMVFGVYALSIFEAMPDDSCAPDVISFNSCISSCQKASRWPWAIHLLFSMVGAALAANSISYNAAIGACQRTGHWQQALQLLRSMPTATVEPSVISYNVGVSACEEAAQWQAALQLFGELCGSQDVAPDAFSYNAVFRVLDVTGHWQMVLCLFRDMASRRVCPSVVNFNTAISALGREGQWQLTGQMLGDMVRTSVSRDVITYNATVSSLETASEWELAVKTFASMMEDGVVPTVVSFNACIRAFEAGGCWNLALQLLEDMPAAKVSPDVATGNAVINACGKNAQWLMSMQLFRRLPEMQIAPDTVSFNTTMSILEAAQLWEEALDLFRSMLETRISPDHFSYNAAMSAGAQGGQWQLARQLFGTMCDAEVMPDVYSYSTLSTAYTAASQWQLAVQLFHSMPAGVATDAVCYNTAMLAYQTGEQWQPSLQLFEDMRAATIPADVLSYNGAISSCQKGAQWQPCLSLLQQMLAAKLPPDTISYVSAISCNEKAGQWEWAVHLLGSMQASHVSVNSSCYNGVMRACGLATEWQRSLEVFGRATRSLGADPELHDGILDAVRHEELSLALFASARQAGAYPEFLRSPGIIDLHDLSLGASLAGVHWWLTRIVPDALDAGTFDRFVIVTGLGKSRSDGRGSVIQGPVLSMLQLWGLDASVIPNNPGRLQAFLRVRGACLSWIFGCCGCGS